MKITVHSRHALTQPTKLEEMTCIHIEKVNKSIPREKEAWKLKCKFQILGTNLVDI